MSAPPCPRCRALARAGTLPVAAVQPSPPVTFRGASERALTCRDCIGADTLVTVRRAESFGAARVAVAAAREAELASPGASPLAREGIILPSRPGDRERLRNWQRAALRIL